jgi:Mrp family chromosome partitioning ATPase/capsular polysaccharide biosynthesis protein
MDGTSPELTWRDYLGPVIARRWLVAGIVAAFAAAAYAYYAEKPPVYKASTKLYVAQLGNPIVGVGGGTVSDRAVQDEATLVTTNGVAALVARDIGYHGSPASLAGNVTAIPVSGADLITITARAPYPGQAARIANGFAQAYIQLTTAQGQTAIAKSLASLQQQLQQLPKGPTGSASRTNLIANIQQLKSAEASGVGNATQVNPASPPAGPSNRPAWEYALIAAFAALIGGVLLAYLLHRLDTRLKSVDQALEVYGRPVFGVILHDANINAFDDGVPALSPRSKEAFRQLRVALDMTVLERRFKTILITSAGPGEGKSAIARNLALAYSEAGRRTALIDGDLRKPALPKGLGVASGKGVCDVLAGDATLDEVLTSAQTTKGTAVDPVHASVPAARNSEVGASNKHGITLLPAGTSPPNPPAVIESAKFRSFVDQLAGDHDVVVIDSSPLTIVSDIIPLLAHVDAVLLVARSGTTDKRSARHAVEVISRVPDVNFVGVVVNGLPIAESVVYGSGYYSYSYGYGYRNGNGRAPSRLQRLITRS